MHITFRRRKPDLQFTLRAVRALPGSTLQMLFADGYTARVQLTGIIDASPYAG